MTCEKPDLASPGTGYTPESSSLSVWRRDAPSAGGVTNLNAQSPAKPLMGVQAYVRRQHLGLKVIASFHACSARIRILTVHLASPFEGHETRVDNSMTYYEVEAKHRIQRQSNKVVLIASSTLLGRTSYAA